MSETRELLQHLQLSDLEGKECYQIAALIGMEAFLKLVLHYGGCEPYIPMADSLIKPVRNILISRDFDGDNRYQLSKKWGLSERRMRDLTRDKHKKIKASPVEGQIKFF